MSDLFIDNGRIGYVAQLPAVFNFLHNDSQIYYEKRGK